MILAIIQSLPNHPRRVVRTSNFAMFQQLCGMLERESYLAGHASCHASMNGFERVLAVDADISDAISLNHGLNRLFEAGQFDALVVPGLLEHGLQDGLIEACQSHIDEVPFHLFLDVARGEDCELIVERQKKTPDFVRLSYPWLNTLTPGRRAQQWLPASCFVAPLALKLTRHLRGVHDIDALTLDDATYLADASVATMIASGPRRTLSLLEPTHRDKQPSSGQAFQDVSHAIALEFGRAEANDAQHDTDDPQTSAIARHEMDVESMILKQVDERCAEILRHATTNNATLWSSLVRTSTAVLRDAQSKGLIKRYHVRCDEETASWGDETTPVVEIWIAFAKRVKHVQFRTYRG